MSDLRISGGVYRGRKITVPETARPTEGRVREALFSILAERLEGAIVLDLFAGSGALGFEALSRGAAKAVLIDSAKKAVEALGKSRDQLGLRKDDAVILLANLPFPKPSEKLAAEGPFDLIFADPPYDFELREELLAMVAPLLKVGGDFVLEHASRQPAPESCGPMTLHRVKAYGGSALSFYRHAALC